MTRNQHLAAHLADALANGRADATSLSDGEWALLLLAAGVHCAAANPDVVARRVLRRRTSHSGYFADNDAPAGIDPGDGTGVDTAFHRPPAPHLLA